MKLRSLLLLAGLALAGVAQAQTVYTVTGTNFNTYDARRPGAAFDTSPISGLQAGDAIVGLDGRPAANYSLVLVVDGTASDRLYTINPRTGEATLLSTLAADPADTTLPFAGLAGSAFGVDFNPVHDRLHVVSDTGQNLRINVEDGLVTTDSALNFATSSIQASAFSNSFVGATTTTLYGIDGATDLLYAQDPPSEGSQFHVGALGVDTGNTIGFDVLSASPGSQHKAYAGLIVGGVTNLYTFNLTNGGAATLVGRLGNGAVISGFAVVAAMPGGANIAVPTLATSGLVLLGLLIGAFAIVVLRQSR